MKKKRVAPFIFIGMAILVFMLMMVASMRITSAIAPAHVQFSWEKIFPSNEGRINFLPVLIGVIRSQGINIGGSSGGEGSLYPDEEDVSP